MNSVTNVSIQLLYLVPYKLQQSPVFALPLSSVPIADSDGELQQIIKDINNDIKNGALEWKYTCQSG